jgi:hypothetical protein
VFKFHPNGDHNPSSTPCRYANTQKVSQVRLLIAGAIAVGLVAIGVAVAVGQQQTGTMNGSPMTAGATATTTTPPTVPPTAKASPTMKAVPPKGF